MKSVLITGTSKGLGKALLEEFLKNNWVVYALARNINSFQELTNRFKSTCIPIQADITDELCSELIKNTIKQNTNKLDLLINNAGNAEKLFGIDNVNPADLDNHFKVHVSGTFRVIKACIPFLLQGENQTIINVSSRKGSIHKINSGEYRILIPYQLAKAAQNMLTVCLNQELKETGIKTYAIHPGNLKTDVAPPDAETEPSVAAKEIYCWTTSTKEKATNKFYNIMDNSIIEW